MRSLQGRLKSCQEIHRKVARLENKLKLEPPGWRRDRLMAVHTGISRRLKLEEIAIKVGRPSWVVKKWFGWFFKGGVDLLLKQHRILDESQNIFSRFLRKCGLARPRYYSQGILQVQIRTKKPVKWLRWPGRLPGTVSDHKRAEFLKIFC